MAEKNRHRVVTHIGQEREPKPRPEIKPIKLTIELNSYMLAYIAAEGRGVLAEWDKDSQYSMLNAIRQGINDAPPEVKEEISKQLQHGVYHQSNACKWMGKDNTVVHLEELEED